MLGELNTCGCVVTAFSQVSAHGHLKFTGQKMGVGAYMEKPFIRITDIHANHTSVKNGGWELTQRWAPTQEITRPSIVDANLTLEYLAKTADNLASFSGDRETKEH